MRCRSCDAALKSSEIIYYPKEERFEDLCGKCLSRVRSDCFEAGWEVDSMFKVHDMEVEV